MVSGFPDDFVQQVIAAIDRGRTETLQAGVPVFYLDGQSNMEVMERPDGRKFEVRYIPDAPREKHYEILRELPH